MIGTELINVCQGWCCQRFYLPPGWRDKEFAGVEMARDMVIPLDNDHYTCRHLTADLRCAAYFARPQFCRTYPDHQPCEHGCAYREYDLDAYALWWLEALVWKWSQ